MSRDPRFLAECRALAAAVSAFPTLESLHASPQWRDLAPRLEAVLGAVRRHVPGRAADPSHVATGVRVVQWNLEHGNRYEQIERALATHPGLAGADLVMLDEVDLGCARSGNRDVLEDLAAALGLHGAWAPLFLETTPGRDDDPGLAAGRANDEGLFGLGVLSRWPIGDARIVALPSPAALQFDHERMVGRHIALIAEILRPGAAFVAVATHLEVHRTREHRAEQMRHIVAALANEARPVVLAGDFNSHTFDRGRTDSALQGAVALVLTPGVPLRERLRHPDRGAAREPLFDVLRQAGFAWAPFNDDAPTLRMREERLAEVRSLPWIVRAPARHVLRWAVGRGALRLDWIAARGFAGGEGETVGGLDGPGLASDHAPIVARLG